MQQSTTLLYLYSVGGWWGCVIYRRWINHNFGKSNLMLYLCHLFSSRSYIVFMIYICCLWLGQKVCNVMCKSVLFFAANRSKKNNVCVSVLRILPQPNDFNNFVPLDLQIFEIIRFKWRQ